MEKTSSMLPAEAYRFFPKSEEVKTKKGARFYYYGQVQHDEMEREKIKEFYDYVAKKQITLPTDPSFNDQRLLLVMEGQKYKPKKTIEALEHVQQWRKENLPLQLTDKVKSILNQGYIYICGRDYKFRPILVVNAFQLNTDDIDSYFKACVYTYEFIIQRMFLPGQIENWICIYDLGKMGLTDVPITAMKKIADEMSINYGGRLYRMFVVNAPGTIWFGWKVASGLLSDITVQKISIEKDGDLTKLFDLCDRSQVEVRFGGTQPNKTQFWPPVMPDYKPDQSLLMSKEEYRLRHQRGELKRNVVDPEIL